MTSFAAAANVSRQYIDLKYGNASAQDWRDLMKSAGAVLTQIKTEKSEIYANGPRVHGAFQQSQLDVLDQREFKVCAVYDNAMAMAVKHARLTPPCTPPNGPLSCGP